VPRAGRGRRTVGDAEDAEGADMGGDAEGASAGGDAEGASAGGDAEGASAGGERRTRRGLQPLLLLERRGRRPAISGRISGRPSRRPCLGPSSAVQKRSGRALVAF
jgi:hypothetical protein